jgi:hypothetical protein
MTVNEVKKWLKAVSDIDKKIEACQTNIEYYQTKLERCTNSFKIRVRGGTGFDKEKYMDLINDEYAKIDTVLKKEKAVARYYVEKIKDEIYGKLLKLRYFDGGLPWEIVAQEIKYSVSHTRGFLHRKALKALNDILHSRDQDC